MGRLRRAAPRRTERFRNARSGNFATMTALFAPVAIALAAFAVDEGSLYVERREAQSVTDLAAIAAAANLDAPRAAAAETFMDNGLMPSSQGDHPSTHEGAQPFEVKPGRYEPDPSVPVGERFVEGATPFNAARVTFEKTGRRYFSKAFFPAPRIGTSAVAGTSAEAAFSVGSRLLSLDGGILNRLLGALTGSNVSLSVMDYDALLSANADLLTFFKALATDIDLEGATYRELLDADVTIGQVAGALARADGMDARARNAGEALRRTLSSPSVPTLRLGRLFDLGALEGQLVGAKVPGMSLTASALEVLTTSASIANGDHQVALDIGAAVPGLLDVAVDLAIGEPPQHSPWFSLGDRGEIVRTAQTRLRLAVELGKVAGGLVHLPIYVDVAFAEANLADISCTGGRDSTVRVDVDARPGVVDLRIADMDPRNLADFDRQPPFKPATLLNVLGLVKATATAHIEIGERAYQTLRFDRRDIDRRVVKTVSTTDITGSLLASLIDDVDLHVKVIGLDLGLSGLVDNGLTHMLASATPEIDSVLANLLSALGIRIGEADIRVHGATCGRPVLVQ